MSQDVASIPTDFRTGKSTSPWSDSFRNLDRMRAGGHFRRAIRLGIVGRTPAPVRWQQAPPAGRPPDRDPSSSSSVGRSGSPGHGGPPTGREFLVRDSENRGGQSFRVVTVRIDRIETEGPLTASFTDAIATVRVDKTKWNGQPVSGRLVIFVKSPITETIVVNVDIR